ncbi:MAG: glycosyl hydrolase family 18 protein, partial [Bacteroidota bacterium]
GSLANALHSHCYKLVITLSYGSYNAGYYSLATVSRADWIQLMAYDQTGWGSGSPFGNPSTYQMALDAVAYWQSRGFTDLSKMVIGVPFYGNQFSSTSGGYAPAITYASIMNANPNLKTDQDQDSLTFFNSAALIRQKIEYAKFNGLKGIMIWELGQDLPSTNTKSLLRAVSDAACDQNPFWSDYSISCNSNVAVGKSVDVSSGSSTASRLTDNNITTVWTSAATDTEWASVNLGAVYNICAVEIVWDNTGIGRDFQIKTSLNDTSWQVVQQRSYNSSLVSTLQGLSVTGKYLGFQGITRSSCNSRYKIAEIRVYGSLAAIPQQSQPAAHKAQSMPMSTAAPSGIRVYPNPSNTQFMVDLSGLSGSSAVRSIQLMDGVGKAIREISLSRNSGIITLETGALPAGLYFIRTVFDNGKASTQKVLVQH